jgi:hypothetical protein
MSDTTTQMHGILNQLCQRKGTATRRDGTPDSSGIWLDWGNEYDMTKDSEVKCNLCGHSWHYEIGTIIKHGMAHLKAHNLLPFL